MDRFKVLLLVACTSLLIGPLRTMAAAVVLPNPIVFVTQYPAIPDFASITSVFGNQNAGMQSVGRGGDLWIRYPDGTLRNLTHEAGYGTDGFQGANAIAVRDPTVSWDGSRVLFSMVIGAPTAQYDGGTWYWQIYQVTGFGEGQTVSIQRVPNQPQDYNNISPTYASDGSIIFVSDQPRNGQRYLYPQLDEYDEAPTPTGLWRLDPGSGKVTLLEHAPSGSYGPFVDSFGRLIFTRWDHLQRDQQAEPGHEQGAFDWASEAADAPTTTALQEFFPEPRFAVGNANGLVFNQFFPWSINQDGSGEETIDHIGRQDLQGFFGRSFTDDPSLIDFESSISGRVNPNEADNWLQISEDPQNPGRYIAIDAPEFTTHGAGQIVAMSAAPDVHADNIKVQYLTPRSTREAHDDGNVPGDFSGHYRNPKILSDGQLIAVQSPDPRSGNNDGTLEQPDPRYHFRLRVMNRDGNMFSPGATLTNGISKTVSYWTPDQHVSYSGEFWELSPVEVRARSVPPNSAETMQTPELQAFATAGVDPDEFRNFLRQRNLALIVARNITSRDDADRQQPFNLRVPGGVQTLGDNGKIYDVPYVQFFQADQVRGVGGINNGNTGRRDLARPLHDPTARSVQPPISGAPAGAVAVAGDGSIAVFVPALRAMTWQSTAFDGTPVVRERYWISAKPGEVRACDSCHGVSSLNQAGQTPPQSTPQALIDLLGWWRNHDGDGIFANGFETP